MTFLLLKALETILTQALETSLHAEPGAAEEAAYRAPQIHLGTLPPKTKDNQDFPFVLVRAVGGEDDDTDGHVIDVTVIAGVHTEALPPAGAHELYNVLDRCRSALRDHLIVGEQFARTGKITWQVGDTKERTFPHPYYLGTLHAQYLGPHVVTPFPADS